jgi:hypothetical protein
MKLKLWVFSILIVTVVAFLVACTDDGACLLLGTWLANDMEDRLIFNDDGSFSSERDNGGTWEVFMSGTYVYSQSENRLTLTSSGTDVVQNLILNSSQDRFGIALDAFLGGDTSTLLGTWTSTQSAPSLSDTRTWTFTATQVWYTISVTIGTDPPLITNYDGNVAIDTVAGTFDVTSSSDPDPGDFPNGTYEYLVLGDGVVITDPNDMEITYYDKQ